MQQTSFVGDINEISDEQIIAQLEIILRSKEFRTAKSIERFLRYVVMKKLAGEEHRLKEYTIGLEVFRRGADYDPRTDAVVRVQASVLRKKLAIYYNEEGAADPIRIDLPKGHYVPCFEVRQPDYQQHVTVEVEEAADAVTPGNSSHVTEVAPAGDGAVARWHNVRWRNVRWQGLLRIAVTFCVGVIAALVFQQWYGASNRVGAATTTAQPLQQIHQASLDPTYLPLWEKFLEPGVSNLLVYGTPQFFSGGGIFFRDVRINSVGEIKADNRLLLLQKNLPSALTPTEVYTGLGETHGVYVLSRFLWKSNQDLRVMRSRMVSWSDLKNSNLIFLSSMRFHTLAKELPFPTDFVISAEGEDKGNVINLRPQPGEERHYWDTYGGKGTGHNYAVITLWPGKAINRRIMILSGSTTWATLAAAEYATDPEYLRQMGAHLTKCANKQTGQAGGENHSPYFQVLLRVEVKDNQPVAMSYVTHHDLAIPDSLDKATPPN